MNHFDMIVFKNKLFKISKSQNSKNSDFEF